MKHLWRRVKACTRPIAVGTLIKVIGTLMDLLIPFILAHILNDVVEGKNLYEILFWGGVMILCSVIAVLFNVLANRMASAVSTEITGDIRHALFERISYLSSRQTDSFTVASLESRLTSDTYNVNQMIGMSLRLGIRAPILLIGGIIMTLVLDPLLTLVVLFTLPFIFFIVRRTSMAGIPLYRELQKKNDEVTRVVREDASGIRVIKALSKLEYEKERFDAANKDAIATEKKAGVTMAKMNPIMTFILNAGMCAVILAGALLVTRGSTEAGTIIAFMSYFTIMANALINVSRIFVNISKGSASMSRIAEVLDAEDELILEGADPIPDKSAPFIEFRKVSFGYNGRPVLKNISFTLEKTQTLGIIGETGSGKSTLLNLLMRFYDPDEGEILIEGVNVRDIPTATLRQKFGVVFQNDFLFADNVKENIRFGRDLSDKAVERAASHAQASEFIEQKEGGYDHMLTIKGANLSGGQKQRTLIARALAADSEILVLDDASSALDYKTDSLLRAAITRGFSHTTVIVVAQRVSSIALADKILLLSGGEIIAEGRHEELLEASPLYKGISDSQMGGAILD